MSFVFVLLLNLICVWCHRSVCTWASGILWTTATLLILLVSLANDRFLTHHGSLTITIITHDPLLHRVDSLSWCSFVWMSESVCKKDLTSLSFSSDGVVLIDPEQVKGKKGTMIHRQMTDLSCMTHHSLCVWSFIKATHTFTMCVIHSPSHMKTCVFSSVRHVILYVSLWTWWYGRVGNDLPQGHLPLHATGLSSSPG